MTMFLYINNQVPMIIAAFYKNEFSVHILIIGSYGINGML